MNDYAYDQLLAERDALKAKVAQLEATLRWYADVENYYHEVTINDCGQRARAALATKEDKL